MEKEMEHPLTVYITHSSMISSLGFGTLENMRAVREYQSGVSLQTKGNISDQPLLAAVIDRKELKERAHEAGLTMFTRLEQLFILTIQEVLSHSGTTLADPDCAMLLATTKGNIELLGDSTELAPESPAFLWKMAERIGSFFQTAHQPEVVSNACISGVSALIVAKRWIENGKYKRVIVAGGDLLSPFITSGFLSFKSLSTHICHPYDARRDGLNLGEACGAVMLEAEGTAESIILSGGSISNDANHISAPSRTGDGLFFAIRRAMDEAGVTPSDVSFVNAHGTATAYNDDMESKAMHLAGLANVPVNSLKSYFGHTLGASGIIETILCMQQLKEGTVLGTLGYETPGTSLPLVVHARHLNISMECCVKTASGFGGCNAAIVLKLPSCPKEATPMPHMPLSFSVSRTVSIAAGTLRMDGETILTSTATADVAFIRAAFKNLGGNSLKFYKMDDLCKLGYVTAGYLLGGKNFDSREIGIILANASSSLNADSRHQALIHADGEEAASPTVFVYTLPNIVAGEICIRHKIQGENTFFISRQYDENQLTEYARTVMRKEHLRACVVGWCDLLANEYKAEFKLIEIE